MNNCAPFFRVTTEEAATQGDEPPCPMCLDKDSPIPIPRIIGLAGHKGSGKNTVADFLYRHFGYDQHAFADSLKAACKAIFGFTDLQLHDPKEKEMVDPYWGFTPRWALQRIGTEGVRSQVGPEVWVQSLFRKLPTTVPVVVTDVRFPNELEAIRKHSGFVWVAKRPGYEGDSHVSEEMARNYKMFDRTILNDGDLDKLEAKVRRAIQER